MSPTKTSDVRVSIDGLTLRVRRIHAADTAGTLPTLVFLHDSLGCVETWRDFPSVLAERVGLNAIVYDREGHGQSSAMSQVARTPRYLEQEAERLFPLLDALGIGNVVLFGHSDGGSIALIAAGLRTERVRAIVTEGAHAFVEEETLTGIRAARESFATTDLATRLARYHGDKVPAVRSAWIDTWLAPSFRDWNIEPLLRRATCPSLIIQGDADEFGTPEQVRAIIDGLSGPAEALLLHGIGHTPHRDARDQVLDAAAQFVASALDTAGR